MRGGHRIALIIPALDEEAAVADVVGSAPSWVDRIIVVDNGSSDGTGAAASSAGAHVVYERRRGYGSACLAGLREAEGCEIVVFADADRSDDLSEMGRLVAPLLEGRADLVIGSRMLGHPDRGALGGHQRVGNALACLLIRLRWGVRFTDLGPFRAVWRGTLDRLGVADPAYGWTAEMQVLAVRHEVRVCEVPVSYRPRLGRSKISGTLRGSLAAGAGILRVVLRNSLRGDLPNASRRSGGS